MSKILTNREIWEALGYDHTPADLCLSDARKIEAAILEKLQKQNKPIYQLRYKDRTWIDRNEQSYKYNLEHGHTVRKLYEHPAPSAPEGWQQFSHTLKYLIGTWRDGKGMFPQGSDKYDESIAAAHLLLKEADWQQGRYFPILAAARSVE